MGDILFAVGWVVTLVMAVDCYRKQRSSDWYWVLFAPGPLGGVLYLIYAHNAPSRTRAWGAVQPRRMPGRVLPRVPWQKPSSPASVTNINNVRRSRDKAQRVNCSRCMRQVDKLVPYEDGRVRHFACEMCVAEIELRRSPSISFKNLEL